MLEVQNKKLEKVVTEKEYDVIRLEKIVKEYADEREHLLYQVTDA